MSSCPHNCPTLQISSKDLLDMQELLCSSISGFLAFDGHALYFPTSNAPETPQLLSRERKLLVPLIWNGKRLAVLMLHKVHCREIRRCLHMIPAIASLCLENLARARAQTTDSVTGCATQQTLRAHIAAEAALVREHLDLRHGTPAPMHRLFMGLVTIPCLNGPALDAQIGFAFTDSLMLSLANACQENLPSDVLVARVGRHTLALLCTTSTTNCRKLATSTLERLQEVSLPHPTTGAKVEPVLTAGYALYPRDMPSGSLHLPFDEQAHILLEQASLASRVARPNTVLPMSHMLCDGGRILEIMAKGRVLINLGTRIGATMGQRFAVFAPSDGDDAVYKGELTLVQLQDECAVAETSYLEDTAITPAVGDSLRLQNNLEQANPAGARAGQSSMREDILSLQDFLVRYALERDRKQLFTLAILRLGPADEALDQDKASQAFERAVSLWNEHFTASSPQAFAGQRGLATLIAFHPDEKAEDLQHRYAQLCAQLQEQGFPCATGLAPYPFLAYSRNEVQDCALKALEYAQLLPAPHVGVCDSLALNISADKLYSLGDVFGAIDEYKLALLADAQNAMAWNSLGVCMAALGKPAEARRHFLEGLRRRPDAAHAGQICYNLGTVCQNLGERRAAARYYHLCLKHDASHIYAWIRLGQLREQVGRRTEAKRFYEKAAAIEEAQGHGNLARRHLAGVAARLRKSDEARELLQDALRRSPNDAAAMLLLAKLYLDGNEDPAMAEFLARKSVGLHNRPDAWQTLARALRALGREDEACLADARAMLA